VITVLTRSEGSGFVPTRDPISRQRPAADRAAARLYSGEAVRSLTWGTVVDALERALFQSFDPELDPERSRVTAAGGELLVMPSRLAGWVRTKLVTVSRGNPDRGLPLLQGAYVLVEAETGTPIAFLDYEGGRHFTGRPEPGRRRVAQKRAARSGRRPDPDWGDRADPGRPPALADVVRGERLRNPARPQLFTGTGMSWQDLVTAVAVVQALRSDEAQFDPTTRSTR
jgi:hypothetical protein